MATIKELSAVVVGGSVAGLSCAVSLLYHHRQRGSTLSLKVFVLEKARSLTAAGAGLGLDPTSCDTLLKWGLPLLSHIVPLSYEENRVFHPILKLWQTVAKDQSYNYHAAHWSDLHRLLYDSLPGDMVKWDHEVTASEVTADGLHVNVYFKKGGSSTVEVMQANLLIAADGSMSGTRTRFLPDEKRYCGYCAWRGVLNASSEEGMKLKAALQEQYPDLGHCLYFDIAEKTHAVLYELKGNRLNWLWYVNQPEPNLRGLSVTAKADDEAIEAMRVESKHVWSEELASLMQGTPAPFLNAIFDREPLKQLVWGRIVLVGEAAHPTSPHVLRSTNMSIMDADVLGQCMVKFDWQVDEALKEYEALRLPQAEQQVLFSRYLGQVKQGLLPLQLPELLVANNFQWENLLQNCVRTFEEGKSESLIY
ncbi:hypothetical protein GOP47_0019858 [Adiantum capillus-veneris]|uniref:FAD-binding domain-containing protein n=1 Tax=Adiantum capillus-veneris TaxID=13818 RepID=A0A9D4UCU5_ADICA|nr:hypothetical protein GOP47_0019858 [Adiantum capillus-veneris]